MQIAKRALDEDPYLFIAPIWQIAFELVRQNTAPFMALVDAPRRQQQNVRRNVPSEVIFQPASLAQPQMILDHVTSSTYVVGRCEHVWKSFGRPTVPLWRAVCQLANRTRYRFTCGDLSNLNAHGLVEESYSTHES